MHDLGHGPYSHLFDRMIIPKLNKDAPWTHEDASEMLFDYLVEKNNIDIEKEDSNIIKCLIKGKPVNSNCDNCNSYFILFNTV